MTSLPDIITRLPAGAGQMSDIKELVKRLRAEEGRMVKLFDLATECRDKHRGHASFADFNDIKHGIAGRDPVLMEAAAALEGLHADCAQWQEAAGQAAVRGEQLEDRCEALERERDEARAEVARLREALNTLLAHVDSNTCQHENTSRGGCIWTICDECGEMWADDKGGFRPYVDADAVHRARTALSEGKVEDRTDG